MKIKSIEGTDFEVLSSNEKCLHCTFQCEVIIKENTTINIYCRHPKGPGHGEHCIYFKEKKLKSAD